VEAGYAALNGLPQKNAQLKASDKLEYISKVPPLYFRWRRCYTGPIVTAEL